MGLHPSWGAKEWLNKPVTGVWSSADNGLTWQKFGEGIEKFWVSGVAIESNTCSTLYASSYGSGLWKIELPPCL